GIDGGGSKTRALLADPSGEVIGVGSAGSSNQYAVGLAPAIEALLSAIAMAEADAGVEPIGLYAAATLGLAGVDRPGDERIFLDWLAEQRIAERYSVVNDAELILAAGTPAGWGVALIAGTGSICYGRDRDGRFDRCGGWGWLLGDEGSGYWIGNRALHLATQTADGRRDDRAILSLVMDRWGVAVPGDLVARAYERTLPSSEIAALATGVADLAAAGDAAATQVIEEAAGLLAEQLDVVCRKLRLAEPPVALGGGLLTGVPEFTALVVGHAQFALGPVSTVDDPAIGAVALARRLLTTGAPQLNQLAG
ncbi:MAG TPA: BadF/BadG/BcrA/BcrD ATPase family protein, partial [Thermomicrobiaceae bacterium]|nr:BadF/BadG/BcrA/BcrD ATPase family protein [Thermomicrobiaceae bacterium]